MNTQVEYKDTFRWPEKEIRVLAAFCYVPVFGIIMPHLIDSHVLTSEKRKLSDNVFVVYHLTQAYVLFGISLCIFWFLPWGFTLMLVFGVISSPIHAWYAYQGYAFRFWWLKSIFPIPEEVKKISKDII